MSKWYEDSPVVEEKDWWSGSPEVGTAILAPAEEERQIKASVEMSENKNLPADVVSNNFDIYTGEDKNQKKIDGFINRYAAAGMGGFSPRITRETAIDVPVRPVKIAKEIAAGVARFAETGVGGTFGGTAYDWLGQFIEQGGYAVDQFSKIGTKNKDQVYNPFAESIIATGQNISKWGKESRKAWAEQAAYGWEALDPKLKEEDPISYGAGRISEGVTSSALSVLAVYLSGGAAAPALLNKGLQINRGLVALSTMSAAGGFQHAQEQGENFYWSTVQGLADGGIEYAMETSFLEGVGKGKSAITAGFKEGGEEFFTGMLQNTRAGMLENENKGMTAYEGAKDAIKKALIQSPWEVAAGFIGGSGIQGGANLTNIVKSWKADVPVDVPTVSADGGIKLAPPTEAVKPPTEPVAAPEPVAKPITPAKPPITPIEGEVVTEKIFVHETDKDFDKFDLSKAGTGQGEAWLGKGIYLNEKGSFKLEQYGKNKIEVKLSSNAKIFEVVDTPESKYRDTFVKWAVENTEKGQKLAKQRQKEGLDLKNLLPRDILRNNPDAVKKLVDAGYDGLYQDGELVIYNPDVLNILTPTPPKPPITPVEGEGITAEELANRMEKETGTEALSRDLEEVEGKFFKEGKPATKAEISGPTIESQTVRERYKGKKFQLVEINPNDIDLTGAGVMQSNVDELLAKPASELPPPIVARKVDGTIEKIDGAHRIAAAQQRGDKTIKVFMPTEQLTPTPAKAEAKEFFDNLNKEVDAAFESDDLGRLSELDKQGNDLIDRLPEEQKGNAQKLLDNLSVLLFEESQKVQKATGIPVVTPQSRIIVRDRKAEAKQPWEMTKDEFKQYLVDQPLLEKRTIKLDQPELMEAGRKEALRQGIEPGTTEFGLVVSEEFRKQAIQKALAENKPVPREVLEEYKSEKWAQEALAKKSLEAEAKPVEKKEGKEPSGGVSWQQAMKSVLDLAEKDRPKIRQQQKKTLSERVGAQAGTLEWLRKKGVAGKEAIHKSAGKLKGALADYEGRYQPLSDILQPATIEAAENDMADTDRLTSLDKINLTNFDKNGAWDKMLRGAAMTPGDVKLIRKWQPILAKEAAKRVPLSSRVWEGLEWMLGTLKFGAAFDVQIRRQARWLRGRHPVLFTKAVGRDLAAYVSKEYADRMAKETTSSPYHRKESGFGAKRYGLKFLPRQPISAEQRPEQFVSSLPETLPWLGKRIGTGYKYTGGQVGRVYAASMRGFIDSFNWMQQKMWDMQIEKWKSQNVEITQKMLHDLVDFQNTMLGMSKPKTNFGGAVNRVMRPVMWSPSLTWSRIRTPSLMLSNPTMRGEVAASLSTFIGTGLMYLAAASMLARWWNREDPVEWDINSSDFGKIRIGDTRWDVYGDGGPYIRALLQAWAGTKKNQAGRVTTKEGFDKLDPFKQLLRNKRAPALDMFAKIWSGRNYYGGDAWALPDYDEMRKEGGTKEWFADWHEGQMEDKGKEVSFFISKEVYDRYMPFFIQGALEAAWNDGWPQAIGAGTDEFFSGQALSYKPSTNSELQIVQDIAATQEYDKIWDELTPKQQERLYRQVPEMEELEMKKSAEKLPPEEISLTKQNRAAKRIFKAMPDDVKKEMNAVGVKISAPSRKVGKFFLSESRYTAYEEYSRQEIEKSLSKTISSGRWARMDKAKRMKTLKDDIIDAKAEARKRLLREINRGDL